MRTTLNLDDELMRRARIQAIRTNRTLSRLIEDAVRQHLASVEVCASEPNLPRGRLNIPLELMESNAALLAYIERLEADDAHS
jgi:hypothetical protein